MRKEKGAELLRLARRLASTSDYLTKQELASEFGVGVRTLERAFPAIESLFGQLEVETGLNGRRGFRLKLNSRDAMLAHIQPAELAELELAAADLDRSGRGERAAILRELARKVELSIKPLSRNRLATDWEAILQSEELACRPEPMAVAPEGALETLREAMLSQRTVSFVYGNKPLTIVPWGLLIGQRSYLIGNFVGVKTPFQYRLDRMRDVRMETAHAGRPAGFDLHAYARQSFGTFQEAPQTVILRFSPQAADDAAQFLFHPTQELSRNGDGSLTVTFHAGGLRQMAHHLFTWGNTVTIIEPQALRDEMAERLDLAQTALQSAL